ncbi:hypothetical protein M378DRAFT_16544 [Amanita muscaria Koide BX008]|uniref:Uncharacterized protein n=1 Tax=Amanita muscaria (strain Koide BX008) TaxID=946122 RepID=A0A0C2S334_AMAMK|nr:hypothetical protein M378DRAFT_16544 [Amanita muscaria Koide BX008]
MSSLSLQVPSNSPTLSSSSIYLKISLSNTFACLSYANPKWTEWLDTSRLVVILAPNLVIVKRKAQGELD